MKKFIMAISTILLLIVCCACVASAATVIGGEYEEGYYTYKYMSSTAGTGIYITEVDKSISGDVAVPYELSVRYLDSTGFYEIKEPVLAIGDGAFENCDEIKSLVIPGGVEVIYQEAFSGCDNLEEVSLGCDVISVGQGAFSGCSKLKTVNGLDGIAILRDNTFKNCVSLESFEIPNVLTVGYNVFSGCKNLKTIVIPENVVEIGSFGLCSSLENIIVDENNLVFSNDENGVLFDREKSKIIKYPQGKKETKYAIPYGVTVVGACAFEDCDNLKEVIMQNNVSLIGSSAFRGSNNLEKIIIPKSVLKIEESAFSNCTGLKELTMPAYVLMVETSYVWSGCVNIEKITLTSGDATPTSNWNYYGKKYSDRPWNVSDNLNEIVIEDGLTAWPIHSNDLIRESVKSITFPANINTKNDGGTVYLEPINEFLKSCVNLEKVIISKGNGKMSEPHHMERCQSYLGGCVSVKTIIIEDGVEKIKDYAFSGCTALESIIIPDSVSSIGKDAFYNCESLKKLIIPKSVTYIYEAGNHFENSLFLDELIIPASVAKKKIGLSADKVTLTVNKYGYSSMPGNGVICGRITVLEDGIEAISDNAFAGCTNLEDIVIPESVTSIGAGAFSGCTNLKNIDLPDSVITVGKGACADCIGLETVEIGTTEIAENMFAGCRNLKNATILGSVKNIGASAFYNCSNLEIVTLHEGIETIGQLAFYTDNYWKAPLKNITLPESVKYVGPRAFGCRDLDTVVKSKDCVFDDSDGRDCLGDGVVMAACGSTAHIHTIKYNGNYTFVSTEHGADIDIFALTPTCTEPGGLAHICSICNETYLEDAVASLGHIFSTEYFVDTPATCTDDGVSSRHCTREGCKEKRDETVIPATGHDYENAVCKNCGDDKKVGCDCNCHKTGFVGFFNKILRFFWKLFKTNYVCKCGAYHY